MGNIVKRIRQIEHIVGLECRQRNSNPRFTAFPALSVDPRVGISRSASKTDVRFFFLPMTLKITIYYPSFLSFLTFFTTFFELHSVFFVVVQK